MKGLLMGGTSHCGKSTLAEAVATGLGLSSQSTDRMARHPGRPWLGIPDPVAEFLGSLSDDTIYWFLRVHHANMWPLLAGEIERADAAGDGFVFEGTALRPESMATLPWERLITLCLHAEDDFLVERIRRESAYGECDDDMRRLIDAGDAAAVELATAELIETMRA